MMGMGWIRYRKNRQRTIVDIFGSRVCCSCSDNDRGGGDGDDGRAMGGCTCQYIVVAIGDLGFGPSVIMEHISRRRKGIQQS